MSDAEVGIEGGEAPKKKGLPLGAIAGAAVPVVTGLAAAGLAFFLTPAPTTCAASTDAAHAADALHGEYAAPTDEHGGEDAHKEKKGSKKKAKKSGGHGEAKGGHGGEKGAAGPADVSFVPVEPLVVSLSPDAGPKFLRITMQIETPKGNEEIVVGLMPRLRDVLNGYLRSVEESDLADPASMARLRAQMLRRLQLVAPEADISNILITDFVLT
jgi:flagellar FliL protein